MGNESEINKQRRTSRIERGLNPDAPKPPQMMKGNSFIIQHIPPIKNRLIIRKKTRRQTKYQLWMNIEFLFKSYVIDLGQILRQV